MVTPLEDIVTIEEAAQQLGIKPRSVSQAAWRGTLRGRVVNTGKGKVFISTREEVERYRIMRAVKGGSRL